MRLNFINLSPYSCLTALFLSRRPTQQYSFEKPMPTIIYYFILLTTFKEQLTFTTQLYNCTNATTFKAVGLEELVRHYFTIWFR
jgi:hypothetical protein